MEKRPPEDGFSLVEVLVVLLVLAVLMGIGIPTFLGARERAQDRATQATLRHVLGVAKALRTETDSYALVDAAALQAVEGSVTFVNDPAPSTGPSVVSVKGIDTNRFKAAILSASGTCFLIKDGVVANIGEIHYARLENGSCHAKNAATFLESW